MHLREGPNATRVMGASPKARVVNFASGKGHRHNTDSTTSEAIGDTFVVAVDANASHACAADATPHHSAREIGAGSSIALSKITLTGARWLFAVGCVRKAHRCVAGMIIISSSSWQALMA